MRKTKAVLASIPCRVLRDDREKQGWDFPVSDFCAGTVDAHLITGDYVLEGFEKYLIIERKGSVSDFVGSIGKSRFSDELSRMSSVPHSFVILEFLFDDLIKWPYSSHVGGETLSRLPFQRRGAAVANYLRLTMKYPHVHFMFAGPHGKSMANTIFKRVIELYAKEVVKENEIQSR